MNSQMGREKIMALKSRGGRRTDRTGGHPSGLLSPPGFISCCVLLKQRAATLGDAADAVWS